MPEGTVADLRPSPPAVGPLWIPGTVCSDSFAVCCTLCAVRCILWAWFHTAAFFNDLEDAMHARTACGGPAHFVTRPSVQDDSVTGDPADSVATETAHSVTRPPRDDSVTGQPAHSVAPISLQDERRSGRFRDKRDGAFRDAESLAIP